MSPSIKNPANFSRESINNNFFDVQTPAAVPSRPIVVPNGAEVFELRPLSVCLKCILIGVTGDGAGYSWTNSAKYHNLNLLYYVSLNEDKMLLTMVDGSRYRLDHDGFLIVKGVLYPEDSLEEIV